MLWLITYITCYAKVFIIDLCNLKLDASLVKVLVWLWNNIKIIFVSIKKYTCTLLNNKKFNLDGAFGKQMEVEIVNDGPVTLQLEFPNPEKSGLEKSDKFSEVEKV